MRQVGVLAAAGIYALDHIAPILQVDHANAQILAKGQQQFCNHFIQLSQLSEPLVVWGNQGLINQPLHTPE